MQSYLIMLAVRLLEMKRLLKDTGSIYLHCDPTASHYLKMVMDAVFGHDNFRNEIVWCYPIPKGSTLKIGGLCNRSCRRPKNVPATPRETGGLAGAHYQGQLQ